MLSGELEIKEEDITFKGIQETSKSQIAQFFYKGEMIGVEITWFRREEEFKVITQPPNGGYMTRASWFGDPFAEMVSRYEVYAGLENKDTAKFYLNKANLAGKGRVFQEPYGDRFGVSFQTPEDAIRFYLINKETSNE